MIQIISNNELIPHSFDDIGMKVKLQIWDTAGQERFRSITQSYYRSAHCLILVYDISSQPSFDSLTQWCRDIEQFAGGNLLKLNPESISYFTYFYEFNQVTAGKTCSRYLLETSVTRRERYL